MHTKHDYIQTAEVKGNEAGTEGNALVKCRSMGEPKELIGVFSPPND